MLEVQSSRNKHACRYCTYIALKHIIYYKYSVFIDFIYTYRPKANNAVLSSLFAPAFCFLKTWTRSPLSKERSKNWYLFWFAIYKFRTYLPMVFPIVPASIGHGHRLQGHQNGAGSQAATNWQPVEGEGRFTQEISYSLTCFQRIPVWQHSGIKKR